MNFSFFEKILEDRGLAVLIVVSFLFLFVIFGMKWINRFFEKKVKIDLANHSFFTKMDLFKIVIEQVHIHNELKKEMVIDFFKLSLTIFRNGIKEIIMNTKRFSALSNAELACTFLSKVNEMILEYDAEAKRKGIPAYFLKIFHEHHQATIMVMIDDIESIAHNEVYGSQDQKVYVILYSIQNAFHMMIKDANISLYQINGQLNNEIYNSKRIGDYEPPKPHH